MQLWGLGRSYAVLFTFEVILTVICLKERTLDILPCSPLLWFPRQHDFVLNGLFLPALLSFLCLVSRVLSESVLCGRAVAHHLHHWCPQKQYHTNPGPSVSSDSSVKHFGKKIYNRVTHKKPQPVFSFSVENRLWRFKTLGLQMLCSSRWESICIQGLLTGPREVTGKRSNLQLCAWVPDYITFLRV